MKTILIVDDEIKIRNTYEIFLSENNFNVLTASNAEDAYFSLIRDDIDIVLLDINMPDVNGSVVYDITKLIYKKFKIIVSSVYPIEDQKEMIEGAASYYDKSQGLGELLSKINNIIIQNN